ncbi:MAG: alpha/beta hydrolase [Pseudomonadales bacterium]|nr:alpha/beta hydrolase [Pseudomonadales bacterium]
MAYATNGDVKIYYESWGEGFPLILAHGAGGNAAIWFQQIPFFSRKYRVIAFDHRGFARSPCPPDAFTVPAMVDDLRAIMDQEGIDEAALVCQSMGGWTGLNMALESPERVRALVMSHTPGGIRNDEIDEIRQNAQQNLGALDSPFAHWALAPDFHETNVDMANLYNQISAFNTELDMERLTGALFQPFDLARLDDFTVPTLFVTAHRDRVFPAAMIEAVARAVPGAGYKVVSNAGHSSYFETPDEFNQAVDAFLTTTLA